MHNPRAIAIDCRYAAGHTGLGRFTRELVSGLLRRKDLWGYVLIVRSADEDWLKHLPTSAAGRYDIAVCSAAPYSLRTQVELPRLLKHLRPNLVFFPHFTVPISCPAPFVVTVHDLILHHYPNRASAMRQWAYRITLKQALRRARSVIAVSHFTAGEIARHFPGVPAAIVIGEGVSDDFAPISPQECETVLRKHDIQKPFFLYTGNCKEHKNVPLLLSAFVKAGLKNCTLVLVSGGKEAAALTLPGGVRLLTAVNDRTLAALYSSARALVTASLYEGCCLPVLEARACGCPVIAINATAIPEVAGPHARLIAPVEAELIAALCNPPVVADQQRSSWVDTAEQTAAVLRHCLG